jgi:hypothetical protein
MKDRMKDEFGNDVEENLTTAVKNTPKTKKEKVVEKVVEQPVHEYQAQIEEYENYRTQRIAEKKALEEEYPKIIHEVKFDLTTLVRCVSDLKRKYDWAYVDAIHLVNFIQNMEVSIQEAKKSSTGLVKMSNLDIETFDHLLKTYKGKGIDSAISFSNILHELFKLFPLLQKDRVDIELLGHIIKVIEFKLESYHESIVPSKDKDDIEDAIVNGLPKKEEEPTEDDLTPETETEIVTETK